MPEIHFAATPKQEQFINSRAYMVFFMGPRGEGKFLVRDAPVLTPTGWVKAGDLNKGDDVIAGDGTPTRIVGVYPQPEQPLWRLHFSDGTSALTSDDHMWAVETSWDRDGGAANDTRDRTGRGAKKRVGSRRMWSEHRGTKVVATREIRERLAAGCWKHGGRWSIPLVGPVAFPQRASPLDPYLLGLLLGDGGITHGVMLTTADAEIVAAARAALPPGDEIVHRNRYTWAIRGTGAPRKNKTKAALVGLGLSGHGAAAKFVPRDYLWNDADTRLALLQGLLDTDGTILGHSNSVSFTTISEQLALDVAFLVRSLGGLTKTRTRITTYTHLGERRQGQLSYHLSIRLPNGVPPFRLSRKAAMVKVKGERNRPKRYIVGYDAAGEGGGVCFKVAHPSGLFVIHDFIVTHNTVSGVFACLAHAMRHSADLWPVRWAVIRDTWENLRVTTVPSIRQCVYRYGIPAEGVDLQEPRVVRLGMKTTSGAFRPIVEFNFFGLDQPQDANRLQGFEAGGAWIEEPAPAADLLSGVPEDALLAVTSLRQQGVEPRVQITMNPPDENHWTMKYRDDADALAELAERGLTVDFIEIPAGENPGVTEEYRARNRVLLEKMGRYDLVARLVEGKIGFVQQGVAVLSDGNGGMLFGDAHCAKTSLPIMRRVPIIRGWDGGLNPTTTWLQITPIGYIHIFMSIRGVHVGMEQHIEQNVWDWERAMGLKNYHFEDYADPSMFAPDQKNSEVSQITAIEEMLKRNPTQAASVEPGPIAVYDRIQPLKNLLTRNIRGVPRIQVDAEARAMKRALSGGWHYKKTASGLVADIVKDEHSEHGDALCYPISTKFPIDELVERRRPRRPAPRVVTPTGGARQAWMAV